MDLHQNHNNYSITTLFHTTLSPKREEGAFPPLLPVFYAYPPPKKSSQLPLFLFRKQWRSLIDSTKNKIESLKAWIREGHESSKNIQDKEGVFIISHAKDSAHTFTNALLGECQAPKEGTHPSSAHTQKTNLPHGFGFRSLTTSNEQVVYCVCPAMSKCQSAEHRLFIEVTIKNTMAQAQNVKLVLLINYSHLIAKEKEGLFALLKTCTHLFSHLATFKEHIPSILFGITHVPPEITHKALKKWAQKNIPSPLKALASQLFIFDPSDSSLQGRWNQETSLSRLDNLPSIKNPSSLFKTVLTRTDEEFLIPLTEQLNEQIHTHLNQQDFTQAFLHFKTLKSLECIGHTVITCALEQSRARIKREVQRAIYIFKMHCYFNHFSSAATVLKKCQEAKRHFPTILKNTIYLSFLHTHYKKAKARHEHQSEIERIREEKKKRANSDIQVLFTLIEEEKKEIHKTIEYKELHFEHLIKERQKSLQNIQICHDKIKRALCRELKTCLTRCKEELKIAKQLKAQHIQDQITQEKDKLQDHYEKKLKANRKEENEHIKRYQKILAKRKKEKVEEQTQLAAKMRSIENKEIANIIHLA